MDIDIDDLEFAGVFTVDSGQAIVGDPCYLDDYDTNKNEEWNLEGKTGTHPAPLRSAPAPHSHSLVCH